MKPGPLLFAGLFATTLVLDQATKAWARSAANMTEGFSLYPLWPGVFELKLVFNHGIAFGLAQGFGVFMAPVAIFMAVGAAWYSWKHADEKWPAHMAMGLLASGAIGNLIDRLWMGKVTDMFWIRLIDFPVFNIADVCITVAGTMLFLGAIADAIRPRSQAEAHPDSALERSDAQES